MKKYSMAIFVCASVFLAGCGMRQGDDVQTAVRNIPSADATIFDCNGQVMRVDLLRDPVRAQIFFDDRVHDPIVLDLVQSDHATTTYMANGISFVMHDDESAELSLVGETSTVTCTQQEVL